MLTAPLVNPYLKARWKIEEIEWLNENYPKKGRDYCCKFLDRTESSVREMASKLGLKSELKNSPEANYKKGSYFRGKKRPEHSEWLKENHPMLGKKLSQERRDKMSLITASNMRLNPQNCYSNSRRGYYVINTTSMYFRSSWEANYALYLEWLKSRGDIVSWEFEPETFWFENIKRGVRSYLPDFRVTKNDNSVEYHEVKGYFDQKSKTKIKRMAKYYPKIKLVLIDSSCYKDISKKLGKVLKFY